jgi:hypothetical protein
LDCLNQKQGKLHPIRNLLLLWSLLLKAYKILIQANAQDGVDSKLGMLLYQLASTSTKNTEPHLSFIAKQVGEKKLVTGDQITGNEN